MAVDGGEVEGNLVPENLSGAENEVAVWLGICIVKETGSDIWVPVGAGRVEG